MTEMYFMERGVLRKRESTCMECMHRNTGVDGVILICENENSDHFGHVLNHNHPACDECEIIEIVEDINDATDDYQQTTDAA